MKWINVNDKYPPSDTYVLACLCGKFLKVSYYFQDSIGKWFSTDYDIWDKIYTGEVTHWMTLPGIPSDDETNKPQCFWCGGSHFSYKCSHSPDTL